MKKFIPTLFWITGLSGSGKTTLGTLLTEKLRKRGYPVVFLDGDILRAIYNNHFGYDRNGRLKVSLQYARLCKMLVDQKIHVVCATISMFHQTQNWNKRNFKNYIEIFLNVPIDELIHRDSKKIYSRALNGDLKNIVGIDIKPQFPKQPDIVINNDKTKNSINLILKSYDTVINERKKVIEHVRNRELYEFTSKRM